MKGVDSQSLLQFARKKKKKFKSGYSQWLKTRYIVYELKLQHKLIALDPEMYKNISIRPKVPISLTVQENQISEWYFIPHEPKGLSFRITKQYNHSLIMNSAWQWPTTSDQKSLPAPHSPTHFTHLKTRPTLKGNS